MKITTVTGQTLEDYMPEVAGVGHLCGEDVATRDGAGNDCLSVRKVKAKNGDIMYEGEGVVAGAYLVYVEDICENTSYYLVEQTKIDEIGGADKYLEDAADTISGNEPDEDCKRIARLYWGLDAEPETVESDYDGDVKIIRHRHFYGPSDDKYEFIHLNEAEREDGYGVDGSASTWETVEAAQDWIDAQEAGIYHLAHNEASAPDYYIVNA